MPEKRGKSVIQLQEQGYFLEGVTKKRNYMLKIIHLWLV